MIRMKLNINRLLVFGGPGDLIHLREHCDREIPVEFIPSSSNYFRSFDVPNQNSIAGHNWCIDKRFCEAVSWEGKQGQHMCRMCGYVLDQPGANDIEEINPASYTCHCSNPGGVAWIMLKPFGPTSIDGEIERALEEIYD